MSDVEMYVQLAWQLLTFWNIYLKLANCWMSYFGANFFLFACATAAADIILSPLASREHDWSEANFTLYSIYTNSCSAAPLHPLFPLFTWTFLASRNICTDTHTYTNTQICTQTCSRLLIHWGIAFHSERQITSHWNDTFPSCLLRTRRGAAPFHQRSPIPGRTCHRHLLCVF